MSAPQFSIERYIWVSGSYHGVRLHCSVELADVRVGREHFEQVHFGVDHFLPVRLFAQHVFVQRFDCHVFLQLEVQPRVDNTVPADSESCAEHEIVRQPLLFFVVVAVRRVEVRNPGAFFDVLRERSLAVFPVPGDVIPEVLRVVDSMSGEAEGRLVDLVCWVARQSIAGRLFARERSESQV